MTPTFEQQRAIDAPTDDNVFCIAGPGSGKTRTLIWRVMALIQRGVTPGHIACITFTNAGAREMESRLMKAGIQIGFVGTLHSFLLNLIRQYGALIGYPRGKFTILDNEEAAEFFQVTLEKHKWKGTAKEVITAIQQGPRDGISGTPTSMSKSDIVAAGYWQDLKRAKLLTFDAILILGERMLQQVHAFGFTHYLIDEIQDSSELDFRIYELLRAPKFLVGDPDQSIFGFRGADVTQCIALTRNPIWTTIPLEGNFRSGAAVCEAAQRLIEHNPDRFAKKTVSAVDYDAIVRYSVFETPPHEAAWIAQEICAFVDHHGGTPAYAECAVLLRTNDLVDEYATHLGAMSIPIAKSMPPVRPADWPNARIVLSFMRNPENDYTAYRCACITMGRDEAELLRQNANTAFCSINKMWLNFAPIELPELGRLLNHFKLSNESVRRIAEARLRLPDGAGMDELLLELTREDEYITGEGVTISTIHAAKGREWDFVTVAACEQHVMPSERKSLNLPEERRLAYVAVTRARKYLHITSSKRRQLKWGSPFPVDVAPSQFIGEMKGLTAQT